MQPDMSRTDGNPGDGKQGGDNTVNPASGLRRVLEQCQKEVQKALNSKDIRSAQTLLEFMMEQYPESKKQAFLQLGHLHYQEKDYQKATEAYMKTIVMGTPKESVRKNIQVACNTLAREAESSKEAARWRDVLINFF